MIFVVLTKKKTNKTKNLYLKLWSQPKKIEVEYRTGLFPISPEGDLQILLIHYCFLWAIFFCLQNSLPAIPPPPQIWSAETTSQSWIMIIWDFFTLTTGHCLCLYPPVRSWDSLWSQPIKGKHSHCCILGSIPPFFLNQFSTASTFEISAL